MASPRALFFFNHRTAVDLADIRAGRRPSERLYGLVELAARGWDATACDERLDGRFIPWLSRKLSRLGLDAIGARTLRAIARADVLLVKDDLSPSISIAAKLLGKPLIYLDSLFELPRHPAKKLVMRMKLAMAPRILSYSRFQVDLWHGEYGVPRERFGVLPYTIDLDFYRPLPPSVDAAGRMPYVVAAGRDLGRDFETLVRGAATAGVEVKLVTLPYLVPAAAREAPHVEILQRIDYAALFDLYRNAIGVAVPLKPDIVYPSGIRAMMEGMAVGRATVSTRTEILEEYVSDADAAVAYVRPGDVDGWAAALASLRDDLPRRLQLERNGAAVSHERFGMSHFVAAIEREIGALFPPRGDSLRR